MNKKAKPRPEKFELQITKEKRIDEKVYWGIACVNGTVVFENDNNEPGLIEKIKAEIRATKAINTNNFKLVKKYVA